jgi:hypothetical protein
VSTNLILNGSLGTDTSDATATAEYILTGYTGYVNDQLITGTMPDHGAVKITLNCGQSYTIPKGYHNGSGTVTVNSLASQTDATATAAQILSPKTCWVKGVKITGTMPNNGAISYSLPLNGTYKIPAGYHNGSGKVTQSIATQGGWTITPTTTNKLGCAANRYCTGNIYVKGDGNLVAWNIKKGVNIFGVTGTYQGF